MITLDRFNSGRIVLIGCSKRLRWGLMLLQSAFSLLGSEVMPLIRRLCSSLLVASLPFATALPAQAIPLIGVGASAGAYAGYMNGLKSGPSYDLEGSARLLGLDAAGTVLGSAGGSLLELGLRKQISFIPMLSVKPMIGYQGQSLFTATSTWDNGPMARVDLGFSPILSPIWFEGSLGASYPLTLAQPVASYMLGAYFDFLPISSVGLRYRGYHDLNGGGSDISIVELGLRVSI